MGKDSAARIELGRSFHQMGTVNEKVCESDFVPLWDGLCLATILSLSSSGSSFDLMILICSDMHCEL